MVEKAKTQASDLAAFREAGFKEVEDFFDLLLQKYSVNRNSRSKKGAITLTDFSGLNRVEIAISNRVTFDSRLKIAKLKIDEYLEEATRNASSAIKTLVMRAFEVDKKGDVDAKKILSLKSYDITDSKWTEAIAIINEATKIEGSKRYIRFYSRPDQTSEWEYISLDAGSARKHDKSANTKDKGEAQ
jgi:hypothetical protein